MLHEGAQLEKIFETIKATNEGTSKQWINVQPTVVDSILALCKACQEEQQKNFLLEQKVDLLVSSVESLVRDAKLKEERYRLQQLWIDQMRFQDPTHVEFTQALDVLKPSEGSLFNSTSMSPKASEVSPHPGTLPSSSPTVRPSSDLGGQCSEQAGVLANPSSFSSDLDNRLKRLELATAYALGQKGSSNQATGEPGSVPHSRGAGLSPKEVSSTLKATCKEVQTCHCQRELKKLVKEEMGELREEWRKFLELQTELLIAESSPKKYREANSGEECTRSVGGCAALLNDTGFPKNSFHSSNVVCDENEGRESTFDIERSRWVWRGRWPSPVDRRCHAGFLLSSPSFVSFDSQLQMSGEHTLVHTSPFSESSFRGRVESKFFQWKRRDLIEILEAGVYKIVAGVLREGNQMVNNGANSTKDSQSRLTGIQVYVNGDPVRLTKSFESIRARPESSSIATSKALKSLSARKLTYLKGFRLSTTPTNVESGFVFLERFSTIRVSCDAPSRVLCEERKRAFLEIEFIA